MSRSVRFTLLLTAVPEMKPEIKGFYCLHTAFLFDLVRVMRDGL